MSINTNDGKEPDFLVDGEEYFKDPQEPDLSDSVHPKTIESYRNLDMQVPDTPHLAILRPQENMEKNIKKRGLDPNATFQLTQMYRIRDKSGNEFLAYDYFKTIKDMYGNITRPNHYKPGRYTEVMGNKVNDANFNTKYTEEKEKIQRFDIPWNTKEIDKLIARHVKSGFLADNIQLIVGEASTKNKSLFSGKYYAIFNIQDFKDGKFEDLMMLGKRALSDQEPSLHKLKQPVEEDPGNSLAKKGKMG